jgi:hypothetical protein
VQYSMPPMRGEHAFLQREPIKTEMVLTGGYQNAQRTCELTLIP